MILVTGANGFVGKALIKRVEITRLSGERESEISITIW